jgi:hypothetical protein
MVPPHWDRVAVRVERTRITAPDPAEAAGDSHLMDEQSTPGVVGAPIGRRQGTVTGGQTRK